jgi:hypothetical protein
MTLGMIITLYIDNRRLYANPYERCPAWEVHTRFDAYIALAGRGFARRRVEGIAYQPDFAIRATIMEA